MEKLIRGSSHLFDKFERKGKVRTLSAKDTAKMDYEISEALREIKEEFQTKERNSRMFMRNIILD